MSMSERKGKIELSLSLPVSRQRKALDISRSSAYRVAAVTGDADLGLMKKF